MKVTFAPRGILQIDDARIIWRNFAGRPGPYNREGERSFELIIPDEDIADALIKDGWNIKIKAPREEGEEAFRHMKVKVKFNERGPAVYLVCGKNRTKLSEDEVGLLDNIDILSVDLDIRPYDWSVQGNEGRTAYLQAIVVIQDEDRFASRFSDEEYTEPF